MLLVANDHWNLIRGFNPGGNHGSFSHFHPFHHDFGAIRWTSQTTIEEPYDSLSFVPTLLALTGIYAPTAAPFLSCGIKASSFLGTLCSCCRAVR